MATCPLVFWINEYIYKMIIHGIFFYCISLHAAAILVKNCMNSANSDDVIRNRCEICLSKASWKEKKSELYFVYCCIWSFGGTLTVEAQETFSCWWKATFGEFVGYPENGSVNTLAKFLIWWLFPICWNLCVTYVFAKGVSDQVRDPLTPRNSLQ